MTRAAYPSEAVTGSTIVEWVSAGAAAEYMAISPDGGAASASLTPGATILREVIDPAGAVEEMTLLVKGPPGYNPAIGDWWWGVTDGNGSPLDEDGGALLGRLTQCYSCHLPRSGEILQRMLAKIFQVSAHQRCGRRTDQHLSAVGRGC